MTTEDKLQHFLDTCMEDARVRSGQMLDEYMTALEKTFEEHKADTRRREKLQLSQEIEKIEREINKDRKSTRLNSSHLVTSRMPSSA